MQKIEVSPFERAPNLEPEEIGVKPCNNNTLEEDKQNVKISLLTALSISSTDLLSSSEFCKINPSVVNLFPVKINQLPSEGRVNYFAKNWHKVTNDPMILDVVRGYEIPFLLKPMKPRLSSLGQLTKEALDLVDQEIQNMLREGTIVVLDPK